MGTTADSWNVGGALAVTGTTTLTGAVTTTAGATVGTSLSVGTTVHIGPASSYWTTYQMMKMDGTNPPTFRAIRLYDDGAGAWRQSSLVSGTLTWGA